MTIDDLFLVVEDHPGGLELVVRLGHTYVELVRVTYDPDRESLVFEMHPDDSLDALRRVFRIVMPPEIGGR